MHPYLSVIGLSLSLLGAACSAGAGLEDSESNPVSARTTLALSGGLNPWEGNVAVEFLQRLPTGPDRRRIPFAFPSLRSRFERVWTEPKASQPSAQERLCATLKERIKPTRDFRCSPAASGTLAGRLVNTHELELEYRIENNSLAFVAGTDTIFGSYLDPTIYATFDVTIGLTVHVDPGIETFRNPSEFDQHPLLLQQTPAPGAKPGARIAFGNVRFSTPYEYVPEGDLRDAERELASALAAEDTSELAFELNQALHDGAKELRRAFLSGYHEAGKYFELSIALDAHDTLVIEYAWQPNTSIPKGCHSPLLNCDNEVVPFCENAGLDGRVDLEKRIDGEFRVVGRAELPDMVKDSDPFAHAPDGSGYWTYRVCYPDRWGSGCGPEFLVKAVRSGGCGSGVNPEGNSKEENRRRFCRTNDPRRCTPLLLQ